MKKITITVSDSFFDSLVNAAHEPQQNLQITLSQGLLDNIAIQSGADSEPSATCHGIFQMWYMSPTFEDTVLDVIRLEDAKWAEDAKRTAVKGPESVESQNRLDQSDSNGTSK